MKIFPIDSSMKKTKRSYEVEVPTNGSDDLPFTGKNENGKSCERITQTQEFIAKKKKDLEKRKKKNEAAGIAFNDKELGAGIAFNDVGAGLNTNYVYTNEDLEKDLDAFENVKTGGAIPAIVGELALNLVAQAPAIISALKARKEGKNEGSGNTNEVVRLLTANGALDWDSLDEEDYDNLIEGFKKIQSQGKRYIKRDGSGITANSGKIGKFFKSAWNWLKNVYNNNKDIIDPLKDALVNTAKTAVSNTIDKGTEKLNSKIKNETIKDLVHKTGETVKQIGDRAIDTVTTSEGGKIPKLDRKSIAINKAGNYKIRGSVF